MKQSKLKNFWALHKNWLLLLRDTKKNVTRDNILAISRDNLVGSGLISFSKSHTEDKNSQQEPVLIKKITLQICLRTRKYENETLYGRALRARIYCLTSWKKSFVKNTRKLHFQICLRTINKRYLDEERRPLAGCAAS